MKITDKRLASSIRFSELACGDCYKDGNDVFMRILEITASNDMKVNCISLTTGLPYYQDGNAVVVGVDTELILRTRVN
jgi:hypothetical protein